MTFICNISYLQAMKYRQFGRTDFKVSALGMGCMRLPVYKFWPLKVNTKKTINLIRRAIDSGINYFDTGLPYHLGQSEKVLGSALLDGYREKIHLVTKLPVPLVRKADDFDRILSGQLERLKTDYIDTYLFHGIGESTFNKLKNLDLISKMEQAREKGLIKNIGFSFHDTLPVFKKIIDFYNWDVVQIQYNYLDTTRQASTEGLEYAYKKNMAIVVMEPLKGGLLVSPPEKARKILESADPERTPVQWALDFLWDRKEVSVVLSGMGSRKMLDENCRYAENSDTGMLLEKQRSTLETIVDIYRKEVLVPCTACNYCMPCPFGVKIPDNFAIINAANKTSANFQDKIFKLMDKRRYKKLTGNLLKIDKNNPNGNASICTECGECIPKCPQSINIPEELKKVHRVLSNNEKISTVFDR